MSGILLAQQQILLPRLISGLGFSSNGPAGILGASIFVNQNGAMTGFSNSAGTVDLQRWLAFQANYNAGALFQAKLDSLGPTGGWTDSGNWRDIVGSLQWDGVNSQAAGTFVTNVRMTFRLRNSTVELATQTYQVTWNFS